MASVAFLVLSAIVASAVAEYPLPHSFYPPPPPKPHSVYGVPDIYKPVFSEPQPITFDFSPETTYDIPEFKGVPDLPHVVPEIHHHEIIPEKFPPHPVASHNNYEVPEPTVYTPPKFEVPAPVYGLPKAL